MFTNQPTHLQGDILDPILTPDDSSVVSNVWVSEFISNHALVLGQLGFCNPSVSRTKNVTVRRYHKIKMGSFRSDQANC